MEPCDLCGTVHEPWEPHVFGTENDPVLKANDLRERVPVPVRIGDAPASVVSTPPAQSVPQPEQQPELQDKPRRKGRDMENYRAYMRAYMKRYRAAKSEKPHENDDLPDSGPQRLDGGAGV